jgi:hypothetical protein
LLYFVEENLSSEEIPKEEDEEVATNEISHVATVSSLRYSSWTQIFPLALSSQNTLALCIHGYLLGYFLNLYQLLSVDLIKEL